jgi:hypothetical protein
MWAQARYSLYPAEWRKKHRLTDEVVKYGTVRALRSAATHFWVWDLLQTNPNCLTLGFRDKPMIVAGCSPTDEVAYACFTDGMRRRMGDHPKPSSVFLLAHAIWITQYLETFFEQARDPTRRLELSHAIVTHLVALLGWMRACETFGLQWKDVEVCCPAAGPTLGLPTGIGCVLLTLLAQTKSEQVRSANLVLAYKTVSGLALGPWLERLKFLTPPALCTPESFIICHPNGRRGQATTIDITICHLKGRLRGGVVAT